MVTVAAAAEGAVEAAASRVAGQGKSPRIRECLLVEINIASPAKILPSLGWTTIELTPSVSDAALKK